MVKERATKMRNHLCTYMVSLGKFDPFLMNDMNIDINSFNKHELSVYYRPNMIKSTKNTPWKKSYDQSR